MVWSTMFCIYRRPLLLIFSLFGLIQFTLAQNAIVTENALPGNPISEWGVPSFRENRIAGFATKMSLNRGETVHFKINVQSGDPYTLKIYRIGYYGGNGARLLADLGTLTGTVQPNGNSNSSTGMLDCSNWSESATWAIPANAASGLYIARIERSTGGNNHIVFIVRNDASNSALYLQFPDATWQAYNGYGGNSVYDGTTSWPSGHAVKASYNRPFFPYNSLFNTEGREADWYMNAEYPMIRWLERNGYDVTYTSCNDVANNGSRLLNHKVFISVGHDEYWSKDQRENVVAARNAGVHLAFFSGNEVYWKTRWEDSDGSENRTLVCYKEGLMGDGTLAERACGNKCDPSSEWTGLWRTGGNYDAGIPENGLTGQMSWVEYPSEIGVPSNYKNLRFWRNTAVANLSTGQTAALGINTLGYEWDYEQTSYASFYPQGRITMSSKTVNGLTHKLSLYRHSSGALVFGAGTVQWSWGLDGAHWGGSTTTSPDMQQATVNLFADMGVQAVTLQSGLIQTSASTDLSAPTATITSPANGATFSSGASITFSGSATDVGAGVVAAVEISVNGGITWLQAIFNDAAGSVSWSYPWTAPSDGTYNIKVRGVDDSGNIGNAGTGITITVGAGGDVTPPTISTVTPLNGSTGIVTTTTVIANFNEGINGSTVTTSTFQLRDAANNLVPATVNTSGSQINLTPSSSLSNLTTYTATITGGASGVKDFSGNALLNNYSWSFSTASNGDITPPTVSSVSPLSGTTGVTIFTTVTANFSEAINASTVTGSTFQLRDAGNNLINATVSIASNQITLTPTAPLTISTTYTVTIVGGASGVKDLAGNALASNYSWSFTTGTETAPPPTPLTIQNFNTKAGTAAGVHSLTGVPAGALLVLATTADVAPTDCFVSSSPSLTWTKRSDASAAQSDNAEIWTTVYAAGGSITITSNWGANHSQTSVCYVVLNAEPTLGGASATAVTQSAPSVTINTTRDNSIIFGCTADWNAINGATRTLRDGATERLYFRDGNYTTYYYTKAATTIAAYTEGVSIPTGQKASTALLEIRGTSTVQDNTPPTVSSVAPVNGATGVPATTTVSAIFNEAMDVATISGSTIELRNSSNVLITASVSYNAGTKTAILTPSVALANSSVYTSTVKSGAAGVKDVSGNALVADYIWSFTTEAGDITPPTVSTVAPVNGATGVLASTTVSAIFNEAMDAATINSSTFELRNSSNVLITASISYNAGTKTAILTPSVALANSSIYTAKVKSGTTGVKDVAGNALVTDYSWSFTTEAGDITPPTVSSVAPVNGATGVPASTTVSAIFNEAMNAAIINSSTFELRNSSNVLISAIISYNATTKTATLTPSSALNGATVYTATITGGASGVKDVAGNSLVNNYAWSFTTANSDITPPTVSSVSPLNGATGVSINTTVTANFSEAINASTVTSSTFQLKDAGNNLISATVTTASNQITLTPTAALTASATYTVTIVGGASGVKDLAGNALVNNYSWVYTTAASSGGGTTYTVFQSSSTPAVPLANDGQGIELGMRFRSTQDGFINGIRYYKGTGTTGAHIGSLWNNTGTRLAQATFTGETTSGWQQVLFSTPIAITAGVTYVASYYSPSGDYAGTKPYFTQNIVNGPLIGLADGTDGANGLYMYNATSAFPTSSFQSSNYWVDVVFATGADITAPVVSTVSPAGGATGVSISTTVTATFSEAVNASTVTTSTFQLRDAGNNLVSASVTTASNQVVLTPLSPLSNSTTYTATITGAASGVKDLAGNALASNYSWSFTTQAADIIPPTVSTVAPVNGATGVSVGVTVSAVFNESMNASTINTSTMVLRNSSNVLITGSVAYNTSTKTATLTPSSALNGSTVYTATITGGASGVKDLAGNSLVNNYSWSFTTAAVDNTPPTVSSVSPLNGAAGVSLNTTVTANFSEAINASTVTSSTFQLRDAGNNLISATMSTSSNQITLTPAAALTASATYTVTIVGGAAGLKDLAGNALVNNYTWSFTTVAGGGGTTYTVFQSSSTPAVPLANDGQGIELGMRFRSTQNGFINGIRYYKGAGASGIHTGSLWSNTGTRLAQATFTGETSSGWQQVLFSTPIAITAGITYVASYFSTSGDYAATKPYFTQNIVNGPLIGLADGTDGPNGLYRYTATSAFPTGSFQSSNYWVDVVFTSGVAMRSAAPVITSITTPIITPDPIIHSNNLGQNYPNPFTHVTEIPFTLSRAEKVNLTLFDINGRTVKMLFNSSKDAGKHVVRFNAGSLASGVYYYRILAGDFTDVKKLIIR